MTYILSLVSHFPLFILVSIALLQFPVVASACIPRQHLVVFFEKNSAAISDAERKKISEWTISMNKSFPNQDLLRLMAEVEHDEIGREQLARRRELAVRMALIDFQFWPVYVRVPDEIVPARSRRDRTYGSERSYRVDLEFTPGCQHACGGCPNTTERVAICGESVFTNVFFPWNSERITPLQSTKLRNWVNIVNESVRDQGVVYLGAGADAMEYEPENIARKRSEAVQERLTELGLQGSRTQLDPEHHILETREGRFSREVATRAELVFKLECPLPSTQ